MSKKGRLPNPTLGTLGSSWRNWPRMVAFARDRGVGEGGGVRGGPEDRLALVGQDRDPLAIERLPRGAGQGDLLARVGDDAQLPP